MYTPPPPFLCCSGIWLNLKAVFADEVLGSVLWKALLSATAALFSPCPSLSFAFQHSVWGSETDPSKPSLFPWSISPSLPHSAFFFPGGTAFKPVCTDDPRYHQHPSKWIYSPLTLPGCSATPPCLNSYTGAIWVPLTRSQCHWASKEWRDSAF